jgi:hypothetical protein
MDSSKVTPFGRAYYRLTKAVLVMDVSALLLLLEEYMGLKYKFQLSHDLDAEQKITAMMDVCRKELERRGCFELESDDIG